jgi:hypothetical protein
MDKNFDFGQLPREWWLKTAAQVGASERHAVFAAAKHRGCTNTEAARKAGFGGTEGAIRSEGYRLFRSNKIAQLLALASAEAGGGFDGTLTLQESRQILSSLARGSDPNLRIKAIEAVQKLERDERAGRSKDEDMTAEEIVREVLGMPCGLAVVAALYLSTIDQPRINLKTALPLFSELAPTIAREYSETWQRILDRLDQECRAEADAMAAAAPAPIEKIHQAAEG